MSRREDPYIRWLARLLWRGGGLVAVAWLVTWETFIPV